MNARILFSQRVTNRWKAAEYLHELRKTNEVNTVRILSVMFMAFFLCTVKPALLVGAPSTLVNQDRELVVQNGGSLTARFAGASSGRGMS
jgi:hypothetical protein